MNIKKLLFRDKMKKEVNAYHSWVVEWTSRHGEYSTSTRQQFEVFTSEEDAKEYKEALEQAFAFLRITSECKVSIKGNQ